MRNVISGWRVMSSGILITFVVHWTWTDVSEVRVASIFHQHETGQRQNFACFFLQADLLLGLLLNPDILLRDFIWLPANCTALYSRIPYNHQCEDLKSDFSLWTGESDRKDARWNRFARKIRGLRSPLTVAADLLSSLYTINLVNKYL